MNFILLILFIAGLFLFINSLSKINIISASMDDRFYGQVIDADLQKKIKLVDRLRCLKYFFGLLVSLLLMLQIISIIGSITLDIVPMILTILIIWIINRLSIFWVFKKHKIGDLYNNIKEQWLKEKKVSERHDEEVCLIRGVDDVKNLLYISICWLFTIILSYIYF